MIERECGFHYQNTFETIATSFSQLSILEILQSTIWAFKLQARCYVITSFVAIIYTNLLGNIRKIVYGSHKWKSDSSSDEIIW